MISRSLRNVLWRGVGNHFPARLYSKKGGDAGSFVSTPSLTSNAQI